MAFKVEDGAVKPFWSRSLEHSKLEFVADTAFEAAAQAAFMTTNTLNPVFNPYANDVFFLHGELTSTIKFHLFARVCRLMLSQCGIKSFK